MDLIRHAAQAGRLDHAFRHAAALAWWHEVGMRNKKFSLGRKNLSAPVPGSRPGASKAGGGGKKGNPTSSHEPLPRYCLNHHVEYDEDTYCAQCVMAVQEFMNY